jgi:replicative DNA helicase
MRDGIDFSKKLESAVLGACLLEKTAIGRTYGIITKENFYSDDNKKVYGVMAEMFDKNIPIDCVTVWQQMLSETLHAGNTAYYLTTLTNDVVSTAHLEYHCFILKEMWRKRELERITKSGLDPDLDTREQLSKINQQLRDLQGGDYKKEWYSMDELMFDLVQHQQNVSDGSIKFITTGFKQIDNLNGGFTAGQMIVVGARPSMGKSALIGKMAVEMAKQGKRVGIISLEMDNNQIAARLASVETDISFQSIYRNLFDDQNQQDRFIRIISNEASKLPIYVSDKTQVDVNEIKAKASKLKSHKGCDCIIVDYLQLIESSGTNKNYNREQEVSKISRGLKLMAVEMEMPVIVVCQLNREGTKRTGKDRLPRESDLRESGAIEQDADAILLLHRDFKAGIEVDENGNSTEFEADLLGVKWRNGAAFHIKLDFDPPKMKFSEQSAMRSWKPVPAPIIEKANSDNPF